MRSLSRVVALGLGLAFYTGAAGADEKPARTFEASLSGQQEVPGNASSVAGTVEVQFSRALDQVAVEIKMDEPATSVVAAHLHCAPAGVNGGIVLNLLDPPGSPPVAFQDLGNRLRLQGSYTGANIAPVAAGANNCPVAIDNIASLLHAIRVGAVYANVHTTAFGGGEVRAQILTKH